MARRRRPTPRADSRRGQSWLTAALIGLGLGSIMSTMLSVWLVGIPGMLTMRDAWERGSDQERVTPWGATYEKWADPSNPPVSWSLMDETDRDSALRKSITDQLRSMEGIDENNMFMWPLIPYPVATQEEVEDLVQIIRGICSDCPELTVCLNGQCTYIMTDFARYMIPSNGGQDGYDGNMMEYEAVTRALDEVESESRRGIAEDDRRGYVMNAFRAVARRSTYSDDIGDSEHSNDIYGALVEGETKCYGVSCALKAALDRRGIPSFMGSCHVIGNPDLRHACVVVWLDGEWLVCDPTAAQGLVPPECGAGEADEAEEGYWAYCLMPFETYMADQGMTFDDDTMELMARYEAIAPDARRGGVTGDATC